MRKTKNKYLNLLLTVLVSMLIGALIMLALGHNPIEAYVALFKGAFVGRLNIGTTFQKFVPLLLTAVAFAIAAKVNVFNVGVEGEMYLGAMAAAWVGYRLGHLPKLIVILACFIVATLVGMLWSYIPASLKANWGVNEICVTILMNYIAQYLTSYIVNGPFSAGSGVPQTPPLERDIMLTRILKPSQLTTSIFIAIVLVAFLIWMMRRSSLGFELNTVGQNPKHAQYVGIDAKNSVIVGMLISGGIGGLTGALEVLGTFGYFLDNFSPGIAFDGMLAALIVKNDLGMIPIIALFLSILKSGALGMERSTGVPKSVVDMLIAIFIIFATMETLFAFIEKRKAKKAVQTAAAEH